MRWSRLRLRLPTGRDEQVDWLIIGLGNPGPRYRGTRHNIGRAVVEALAERLGVSLDRVRANARLATCRLGEQRLCLAVPMCFMNESGRAVAPLARFYKIPLDRLLVVSDDLDLPLGVLRLRPAGSAGGHRGLESVIAALGTREFPRLRVGIGRPPAGWDPADYVLAPFSTDEQPLAEQVVQRATEAIQTFLTEGIEAAMNAYN